MKVRSGFVSNSSTSSFVFVVKKALHEQVAEGMSDFHKHCIALMSSQSTCLGEDVFITEDMRTPDGESALSYSYEGSSFDGEIPEGEWGKMDIYDVLSEYQKAVKEAGEDSDWYESSIDC